jgi:hypothetical protein
MRRPDKKALLREAREHTARLRQLAEQTGTEADGRMTQEAIAECQRFIESLEEAKALWLTVLEKATSPRGGKA